MRTTENVLQNIKNKLAKKVSCASLVCATCLNSGMGMIFENNSVKERSLCRFRTSAAMRKRKK